jgi:hypothetical protein
VNMHKRIKQSAKSNSPTAKPPEHSAAAQITGLAAFLLAFTISSHFVHDTAFAIVFSATWALLIFEAMVWNEQRKRRQLQPDTQEQSDSSERH